MRVSLIASELNWSVIRTLRHQLRFFHRRGDGPVIFAPTARNDVPADLASSFQTAEGKDPQLSRRAHFATSDLYVYHYTSAHPLLETMRTIGSGVVILHCHLPTTAVAETNESAGQTAILDPLRHLATFADLLVADSSYIAQTLLASGIAESDRVCSLQPVIPLDIFAPGPPDRALLRQHGWNNRQVILSITGAERIPDTKMLTQAMAKVRMNYPDAILAIAHTEHSRGKSDASDSEIEGITTISIGDTDSLLPYYRSAAIYLSIGLGIDDAVHTLEAMACGKPVVGIASGAQEPIITAAGLPIKPDDPYSLADRITCLLGEDDTYGEIVRLGYQVTADHALDSYWIEWGNIVAKASAWLPNREYITGRTFAPDQETARSLAPPSGDSPQSFPSGEDWQLPAEIKQVKAAASIMLKEYKVRSTLPVFGSLIAWIRRNLTSHLREPYVDPILQNQELFNWQAALALEELARQLMARKTGSGSGNNQVEKSAPRNTDSGR